MALLRRRLAFKRLSMIDFGTSVMRVGVAVVLAIAGLEGESLVFGGIAAGLTTTVLAWASAPAPLPRLRLQAAREVMSYGLPASIASISWVGFRNCDYAIIGARLGAVQAGYYFRAYNLAVEYQKKISIVMGQVGLPLLARSGDEMSAMRGHMVRLIAILTFPLLAILAITAPELVPWLFGSEWTPPSCRCRSSRWAAPRRWSSTRSASRSWPPGARGAARLRLRPLRRVRRRRAARHALGPRRGGRRRHGRPHRVHGRGLQAHGPRDRRELGAPPCGPTSGRRSLARWAWSPWRCRSASGSRLPARRPSCSSWLSRSSGSGPTR